MKILSVVLLFVAYASAVRVLSVYQGYEDTTTHIIREADIKTGDMPIVFKIAEEDNWYGCFYVFDPLMDNAANIVTGYDPDTYDSFTSVSILNTGTWKIQNVTKLDIPPEDDHTLIDADIDMYHKELALFRYNDDWVNKDHRSLRKMKSKLRMNDLDNMIVTFVDVFDLSIRDSQTVEVGDKYAEDLLYSTDKYYILFVEGYGNNETYDLLTYSAPDMGKLYTNVSFDSTEYFKPAFTMENKAISCDLIIGSMAKGDDFYILAVDPCTPSAEKPYTVTTIYKYANVYGLFFDAAMAYEEETGYLHLAFCDYEYENYCHYDIIGKGKLLETHPLTVNIYDIDRFEIIL